MCEPVTAAIAAVSQSTLFAASLAVSAVTAGASYMANQATAEAQLEATNTNTKAVRDAAVISASQQGADLQQRELQENASTALRVNNAKVAATKAASTANASSSSSGLSLDALQQDYDRQYSSYADSQMQQLGFTKEQIARTREGIQAQADGRINSIPLTPVVKPGLGLAIAEFGATAVNTYNDFAVTDPLTGEKTIT